MTRRPTSAVYRRRRLAVGVGAVLVVVLIVWLIAAAVSAIGNSHAKAGAQSSASDYASAENSTSATLSIPAVPIGGPCDPADIVLRLVTVAGHANGSVPLVFDAFTRRNPECRWSINHAGVEVTLRRGGQDFWSTNNCPLAVKSQTVTLHQGTPAKVMLATWGGQASSADGGCGGQEPWAVPASNYILYAAAKGGDPSKGVLFQLVAPGKPLPKPVTASPSASASTKPQASGRATPKSKTSSSSPTPSASPTVWQ